jgi:hypothetical protein
MAIFDPLGNRGLRLRRSKRQGRLELEKPTLPEVSVSGNRITLEREVGTFDWIPGRLLDEARDRRHAQRGARETNPLRCRLQKEIAALD